MEACFDEAERLQSALNDAQLALNGSADRFRDGLVGALESIREAHERELHELLESRVNKSSAPRAARDGARGFTTSTDRTLRQSRVDGELRQAQQELARELAAAEEARELQLVQERGALHDRLIAIRADLQQKQTPEQEALTVLRETSTQELTDLEQKRHQAAEVLAQARDDLASAESVLAEGRRAYLAHTLLLERLRQEHELCEERAVEQRARDERVSRRKNGRSPSLVVNRPRLRQRTYGSMKPSSPS